MRTQLTTIDELSPQVEDALRGVVTSRDMPFYDMMSYHLGWIGEQGEPRAGSAPRVLGSLCLLACQAAGGTPDARCRRPPR